ncbi:MAG: HDOD domain-containing protein [Burkholderiaceae bacterium]
MSSWIQRVGALWGGHAAAGRTCPPPRPRAAVPVPVSRRASEAPCTPEPVDAAVPDPQLAFFEWVLGTGPSLDAPLRPEERRLLARLDRVLAADGARAELLPRAPAVIPRLMRCLRDARASAQGLAARVAKDPHLVAEVLRLANAALVRADEPIADLPQAVARLGTEGLRRAIARVVLKPIFDAPADSLSGRAAPRLWLHAEAKAAECMHLAAAAGLDPFEGYLAGLMHNIGWTAALRAGVWPPGPFTQAFVHALAPRREGFFALLAMPWQLSDALSALAVERLDADAAGAPSALCQSLLTADRHAALQMLGAGTLLATMDVRA